MPMSRVFDIQKNKQNKNESPGDGYASMFQLISLESSDEHASTTPWNVALILGDSLVRVLQNLRT